MSDVVEDGSKAVAEEPKPQRTYTPDEVENIVRDRLKRVKKESESGKQDDHLVNDLKTKLSSQEEATKALIDKLSRMGQRTVKATVEAKLAEAGCLDPELVAESYLTRKVVSLGDDDQIVVSNANNSLDELVQQTLAAKPWLVRPTGPGLGSRSPKVPESEPNDLSKLSVEQIMAKIGPPKGKSFLDK